MRILGTVIAPSTIVTALAFYLGWVRTGAVASYFGLDQSLLGYSTQDYLLRSADVAFIPLGALLSAALVGTWAHIWLTGHLHRESMLRLLVAVLVMLGAGFFSLGAVAALRPLPFPTPFLVSELSPGFGVVLAGYGLHLRAQWLARWQSTTSVPSPRHRWSPLVSIVLVGMLAILSLFWAATEYATALGRGRAQRLAAGLLSDPAVVIYSRQRLHVTAEGVIEQPIGGLDSAYAYRYTGLRLLMRSGGNYFLLPALWSPTNGVAIMLPDNQSLRLEFVRGIVP